MAKNGSNQDFPLANQLAETIPEIRVPAGLPAAACLGAAGRLLAGTGKQDLIWIGQRLGVLAREVG